MVGKSRGFARDRDVDRLASARRGQARDRPAAQDLGAQAAREKLLAASEGQLPDAVHDHVVADVDVGAAAVAGAAAHVLETDARSRAVGTVADAVRPHVVHLEQQPADEPALDGSLHGVEVVVGSVSLLAERTEGGQGALAGGRVNQVEGVLIEEVGAFAAHITHLGEEAVPHFLLHHEVPVIVGEVLAVAGDGLGAEELVLGVEKRHQRIRQGGEIGTGERVTRHGAFGRIAEVVVLVGAEVDAEAAPNGGLAMERARCPSHANARAEILGVGTVVGRALGAVPAAAGDVHHGGTAQNLVRHRVIFVAQTQVQCEFRANLEIVLEEAHGEGAPVSDHALAHEVSSRLGRVGNKTGGIGVSDGLRSESIAGVIQPDTARFHAGLEGVAATHHGEGVDVVESSADFGIERSAADAVKVPRDAERHGRRAEPPVVVVGAVQSELGFVDGGGSEDMLNLQNHVGGNVRHHVVGAEGVGGVVDVSVVDVIAEVGSGGVREPVIKTGHAGVFADGVVSHLGDIIDVGVAVDRDRSHRVGVHEGRQCGRLGQHLGAVGDAGHQVLETHAEVLAQALIVEEVKGLVLDEGAAEATAELVQREGRDGGAVERRA